MIRSSISKTVNNEILNKTVGDIGNTRENSERYKRYSDSEEIVDLINHL